MIPTTFQLFFSFGIMFYVFISFFVLIFCYWSQSWYRVSRIAIRVQFMCEFHFLMKACAENCRKFVSEFHFILEEFYDYLQYEQSKYSVFSVIIYICIRITFRILCTIAYTDDFCSLYSIAYTDGFYTLYYIAYIDAFYTLYSIAYVDGFDTLYSIASIDGFYTLHNDGMITGGLIRKRVLSMTSSRRTAHNKLKLIDRFGYANWVNSSNFNDTTLRFAEKFDNPFSQVFIFGNMFRESHGFISVPVTSYLLTLLN